MEVHSFPLRCLYALLMVLFCFVLFFLFCLCVIIWLTVCIATHCNHYARTLRHLHYSCCLVLALDAKYEVRCLCICVQVIWKHPFPVHRHHHLHIYCNNVNLGMYADLVINLKLGVLRHTAVDANGCQCPSHPCLCTCSLCD